MIRKKRNFIEKKFYAMLAGGTINSVIIALLILSDSVIAGIFIGDKAVAGINMIMSLYSFANFFGLIFALGIPILFSKAIGNFDKEEADRCFGTGLLASCVSGLLLFIGMCVFGSSYIDYYHASGDVCVQASGYLYWIKYAVLLIPVSAYLSGMIFTDGDETLATVSGVAEAVSNILISVIFCQSMGAAGIGLGTAAGKIVSMVCCFIHFLKKNNNLKPNLFFSFRIVFSTIRYSMVDASKYLFLAIYTAFINKYILMNFGVEMIAAIAVIMFSKEIQLAFEGVGEAVTPIMTTYISERCYDGVRKMWRIARNAAVAEGIVIMLMLIVLAPVIPGVLGVVGESDVRNATEGLRILAFSMPFASVIYLITSYYLLIDRIFLGTAVCAMQEAVYAVLFTVVFCPFFGIRGVYAAIVLAPIASYLSDRSYVRLRYGRDEWPLLLDKEEKKIRSELYEFEALPDDIVRTRDCVEEVLKNEGFIQRDVFRCIRLFEELFMLIYDKNPGVTVSAECAVIIDQDKVCIIGRDDGKTIDFSDNDSMPGSFREYAISSFISYRKVKDRHLMAISFNRNMFEMELKKY